MPDPSKSPVNSDDPRYTNGANAKSTDRTTPLKLFTVEDQQKERTSAVKKVQKIEAGNELKTKTPAKGRGW